jgi:hypothetical protein
MLTDQEERELKEQLAKLTDALKKATEVPPPQRIAWDGTKSIQADLAKVASGEILIEQPDPEERQLKPNEIAKTDRRKINANITKIASGEMIIVG